MSAAAALVVKATGKPLLSGFCGHSRRHELWRLIGCSCPCHSTCAACGQALPLTGARP